MNPADLTKGDVIWVNFPQQDNSLLANRHMGVVLHTERNVAMVMPVSSLINREGREKVINPISELVLRQKDHSFLKHDSFVKGHQVRSVPLNWIDETRGVVGRIHSELMMSLDRMLVQTLDLMPYIQKLAQEYAQRQQPTMQQPKGRSELQPDRQQPGRQRSNVQQYNQNTSRPIDRTSQVDDHKRDSSPSRSNNGRSR